MKIGIQLTKNHEKFKYLTSVLKEQINCLNNLKFIHIINDEDLKKKIADLDILICYFLSENIFMLSNKKLKWVHFANAGVEKSMNLSILNSKTIITNAKGIHVTPVSEFTMGLLLYFSKQFKGCEKFFENKKWTQWELASNIIQLKDKTIGIVGYGSIGKGIAKKAKAFGMNVIAVRRLQKIVEKKKIVDELLPTSKLNHLLKNSDFIIISCPLTPLTKGLIGMEELNKMKSSVFIVNIARGEIIDENALIEALKQKKVAGAALDVFKAEPLPENHHFFNLDNVFLSPHISGNFPEYQYDIMMQFADNLNRYLLGKTLKNRVCKKRQY